MRHHSVNETRGNTQTAPLFSNPPSANRLRRRILVIDDDEAMRGMIRHRLQGEYEIVETGDPTEALALALEHKPDCILLDLSMR
jgi:PleD family two-component response regulator